MEQRLADRKEILRFPRPRGPVVVCPYCDGKHDLRLVSEAKGKFECLSCQETFVVAIRKYGAEKI